MNLPSLKKPTERQQLVLIIAGAIGLVVGAWQFSSWLLGSQKSELESLRKRSQTKGYANRSISDLERERDHEKALLRRTVRNWEQVGKRVGTYGTNELDIARGSVTHIKYKVELLKQRRLLTEKSQRLGIELLPGDLGMALEIYSDEKARERVLTLRAVERVADLTLDRHIKRLYAIEPLPATTLTDSRGTYLKVYPVKVEFDIDFDKIFELMQVVFEDDSVFAFDNIQILAGPERDAPLRVFAVMKAMIFDPPKES